MKLQHAKEILKKLNEPKIILLGSNVLFSASTFIVSLLLPYFISSVLYSEYIYILQTSLLLSSILDIGISYAYLRDYKYNFRKVEFFSSIFEFLVIVVIIAVATNQTLLNFFLHAFNVESANSSIFFLSSLANLAFTLNKSKLISSGRYIPLLIRSLLIFTIRLILIVLIVFKSDLNFYFIGILLVLPFIYEILTRLISLFQNVIIFIRKKTLYLKYLNKKDINNFFSFALSTYIFSIIFNYISRYPIIYAKEHDQLQFIIDVGYAMTFIGVVTVFNTTIRSYFISTLNINDKRGIKLYIKRLYLFLPKYILITFAISLALTLLVWLIKPSTISDKALHYTFILLILNFLIIYGGLFTILSRIFNLITVESIVNLIKMITVILITNSLLVLSPVLTISLIYVVLLLAEILLFLLVKKTKLDKLLINIREED